MNLRTLQLSDDFFAAEYREGYFVSEKMKKVWAVELDLVKKFVDVCEKNNLDYYMDGGTLLGAVRHKGFIPWDDDIDIIMPRKDYNKLFEIAQQEFEYPYFFQTTLSEDGFFRTHAQLRNSETTGYIEIDGRKKHINKGIFIDIFVLDGVPDNMIQEKLLEYQIKIEKKILAYKYDRDFKKQKLYGKAFYALVQIFFKLYPFKKMYQHFNLKVLAKYSDKNTAVIGDLTLKWRKNVHWKREWFDGYIMLPFETLELRAPLFYKEVLGKQYGDYMRRPENVNEPNGRCHGTVVFDPETPYREYCMNN